MANFEQYNEDYKDALAKRKDFQQRQSEEVKDRNQRYYTQKSRFEKTQSIVNKFVNEN